jgi:acetyl-CoA synthetase
MPERSESAPRGPKRFPPPEEFRANSGIDRAEAYRRLFRRSLDEPEAFWGEAADRLHWFQRWEHVLDWDEPHARWFAGGRTNLAYNCLDLQVQRGHADKVAFHWEGEPGDRRTLTYSDMLSEVSRFANALKGLGIGKGDRVVLYMPMVPETAVAMLACARIGATHVAVFAGFSAQALSERIAEVGAKAVVTADGGYRRGEVLPLKARVDEAVEARSSVAAVVTVKRAGNDVAMREGRDHWYHQLMQQASESCPAEPLPSEHPLFILHASGPGGSQKGLVHATGGYQTFAHLTTGLTLDLAQDDVYWCTADLGWVTGHSYVVYGPMSHGATQVMVEGAPTHPSAERFWEVIERYGVTVFYSTPTAIRASRKQGDAAPARHDLGSLRLLGTVGDTIDPDTWQWYWTVIGGERCPVVDTWWQTETGGIALATVPGAHDAKPGAAGVPMPGIDAAVVDIEGRELPAGEGGYLVMRRPWPGMLATVDGDDDRFRNQYWNEIPHAYFSGDGARRDEDGYFWIMGRVDDVVNVSGHRLGTMEVESALVAHPAVEEAAVVGRPDEIRGQAIVAFVTLTANAEPSQELREELRRHVVRLIGGIASPDEIRFADALPRSRSGKIMRRLLRNMASA